MTMPVSFPHTLRALETNSTKPTIFALIFVAALLAVWSAWLWRGRVSVYEVSTAARLEAEHVHAVGATVGGRVAASYLALGRRVRRGSRRRCLRPRALRPSSRPVSAQSCSHMVRWPG
jgi:multidrug efflux pump subunit AcrA (membrane-fusion protein)